MAHAAAIENLVAQALDTANRLGQVLLDETGLVRQRKFDRLPDLAETKARLSDAYALQLSGLRESALADAQAAQPAFNRLRKAVRNLQELVRDNARALRVAKTVNERFIRALADAVTQSSRPSVAYSVGGTYAAPAKAGPPAAVPIAVDQEI